MNEDNQPLSIDIYTCVIIGNRARRLGKLARKRMAKKKAKK